MKLHAPAADRNKDPIADAIAPHVPADGTVLEIASGSGQHVVHFARRFPASTFQPSDPSEDARRSIAGHVAEAELSNVRPPIDLSALDPTWHVAADLILCINMIHIAPWEATLGLFAGAARSLPAAGKLVLYGPYRFGGRFLAESNAEFSRSLTARDPSWAVRDLDDVDAVAGEHGFARTDLIAMPANNHVVVFAR